MPFSLDRPLTSEIRRTGATLIDDSIGHLTEFHDPDRSVHETRKLMKELRSLLAFVGPGVSAANRGAANRCWRDVARELAPARESFVRMQTIETLCDRYPELIDPGTVAPVLADLNAAHGALLSTLVAGGGRAALCEQLDASREFLRHFGVAASRPAAGPTATYRRAAKWYRRAGDTGRSDDFHDWRKHVKHLWYQHRMIEDAWPPVLVAWGGELQTLSQLLGDEHDLADLEDALDAAPVATVVTGEAAAQVHRALARKRQALRSEALRLGRLLHAESSKAFGHRYDAYVGSAWRP